MMKPSQCIIFNTSLLLMVSPSVIEGTFIDLEGKKQSSDRLQFVSSYLSSIYNAIFHQIVLMFSFF
jgi:uncharacterized membrane protein